MAQHKRVCFQLQVKKHRMDEYKARHRAVWPEMLEALRQTDGVITHCSCGKTGCLSDTLRRPISIRLAGTALRG